MLGLGVAVRKRRRTEKKNSCKKAQEGKELFDKIYKISKIKNGFTIKRVKKSTTERQPV